MNTGQGVLDRDILPRVFSSLDSVFPEFGWKRTRAGWVATNTRFTKQYFEARADRCVAKMQAGFLVYGDRSYHWLEYLNGGLFPRGAEWWTVVGELGARVGVQLPEMTRAPSPRARVVAALADSLVPTPAVAEYLLARRASIPDGVLVGELPGEPLEVVIRAGISKGEADAAGLVRDGRWAGRMCCLWRDPLGRPASMWGRAMVDGEEPKYLVLAGGSPALFGAETALVAARRQRTPYGVVAVEGMFDQLSLRAIGVPAVGLGRAGLTEEALRDLEGVGAATLLLDADSAGQAGTLRALETWAFSHSPIRLDVAVLGSGDGKDPDELIRRHGNAGLDNCISRRTSAAVSYISQRLASAESQRDIEDVARRAVPFLTAVGVCHPLEAARATDLLVQRGANAQVLRLVSRQLPVLELQRLKESLVARLAQVDTLLNELEAR